MKFLNRHKKRTLRQERLDLVPAESLGNDIAETLQGKDSVEEKNDITLSDNVSQVTKMAEENVSENLREQAPLKVKRQYNRKKGISYQEKMGNKEETENQKWNRSFLKEIIDHPDLRQALEEGNRRLLHAVKNGTVKVDPIEKEHGELYPKVEKGTFLAKILGNYVAYFALEHLGEDSYTFSPKNYLESIRQHKDTYNDWLAGAKLYDIDIQYGCDVERHQYGERAKKYICD